MEAGELLASERRQHFSILAFRLTATEGLLRYT